MRNRPGDVNGGRIVGITMIADPDTWSVLNSNFSIRRCWHRPSSDSVTCGTASSMSTGCETRCPSSRHDRAHRTIGHWDA